MYIYIQIKTHADLLYIYMNVWYEITYIYIQYQTISYMYMSWCEQQKLIITTTRTTRGPAIPSSCFEVLCFILGDALGVVFVHLDFL